MLKHKLIKLSLITALSCSMAFAIPSVDTANTDELKSTSPASNVDAQLEKIYDGVREFHIFKTMYNRWSTTSGKP